MCIRDSITPVFSAVGCDPSLFASLFLSCDAGGAVLAAQIAQEPSAGLYNGLIVAAFLGSTINGTIPLALGRLTGSQMCIRDRCDAALPPGENRMRPVPAGFAAVGLPALQRMAAAGGWAVLDELGYLESGCADFQQSVLDMLKVCRVLAVVRKQDKMGIRDRFTPAIWFPNNRRSFNRGGET